MIFGFNTDIKSNDTTYHVQTEVREQERRLESQVFVSGRCIGKRSSLLPLAADDQQVHELARAQHRLLVESVREGALGEVLNLDSIEELSVQFLGSERSFDSVLLRFRVLSGGFIAPLAKVEAHWRTQYCSGVLEETQTNAGGVAEMRLALTEGTAELEVHASLDGRQTRRRFLVKSARA